MQPIIKSVFSSVVLTSIAGTQAQAQETTTSVGININAWDSIWSAGAVVQITLALLVMMSVVSWAIIVTKKKRFYAVKRQDDAFLEEFWQASSLEVINDNLKHYPASPAAQVFKAGYGELQRVASKAAEEGGEPQLHGSDNVDRALQRAVDNQVLQLERLLSFLATTGSTAPFIGLFGTVWGIMGAFQKIGAMKSASLAVVAPGISEALIATAIGLAAAIPAVMAYNHFLTLLRRQEITLNNFAADYLNIVKRNFFKDH